MPELDSLQERLAAALAGIEAQGRARSHASATLRTTLARVEERYGNQALEIDHYRARAEALERSNADLATSLDDFAQMIEREAHARDDSGVFQTTASARELLQFIERRRADRDTAPPAPPPAAPATPDFKTVLAQASLDRAQAILARFEDVTADELAAEDRAETEDVNGHETAAAAPLSEPAPDLDIPLPREEASARDWVEPEDLAPAEEAPAARAAADHGIGELIGRIARLAKSGDRGRARSARG